MCVILASSELSALQHKLMEDLFAGYNRDSHPGGNATVMVSLGAKLARLVKVVSSSKRTFFKLKLLKEKESF